MGRRIPYIFAECIELLIGMLSRTAACPSSLEPKQYDPYAV
jgi:hypothetical protein